MSTVFLIRLFNTCILLHLAAFEHKIHLCRDWHVIMKICLDELLFKAHESLGDLRVTLLDSLFSSLNLTLSENSHETLNGLNT